MADASTPWYSATIAAIVLNSIPLIAFLALAILAHKNNRGGFSDPVRHGLNWFKVALWLTVAHITFFIIYAIINYTVRDFRAWDHMGAVSSLFSNFGIFVLLLSIAQLAVGAHKADNQKDSRIFINFVRVTIAVSSILYFAYFIFSRYYTNKVWPYSFYYPSAADQEARAAFGWISHAIQILLVIVTIATTAFSIVKRDQARKRAAEAGTGLPPMRRVWEMIIPATSITIVTTSWHAAYSFLQRYGFLLTGSPYRSQEGKVVVRNSLIVIDAIISKWVLLAVFVIIYVLGKKRENGLWSVPADEDNTVQRDSLEKKDQEERLSI